MRGCLSVLGVVVCVVVFLSVVLRMLLQFLREELFLSVWCHFVTPFLREKGVYFMFLCWCGVRVWVWLFM